MAISSIWDSMATWFTPTFLFCISNLIIATLFIASKFNTKITTKITTKYKDQDHDHNHNHDHDHNHNHNHNHDHDHNHNHNHDHDHDQGYSFTQKIPRVTSLLERVKSINLTSYIPTIITTKESHHDHNPSISKIAKYTPLSRLSQSIFLSCSYDTQPESDRYPSSKPNPNPPPSLLGRLKSIDFSSIYGHTNTNSTESNKISNSPDQLDRVNLVKPKKVEMKKSRSEEMVVSDNKKEVNVQRSKTARARRNAADDAKADNFINKFRKQLKLDRDESLVRYNDMLKRPS